MIDKERNKLEEGHHLGGGYRWIIFEDSFFLFFSFSSFCDHFKSDSTQQLKKENGRNKN